MRIDYGTVTSVLSDSARGAQLCHVKSHSSDREYQFCEIIVTKGMASLPVIGDLVVVAEIHNAEIIVMGVLPQEDLELSQGEVFLFNGDKTAKLEFFTDGAIKITGPGGQIQLNADGDITVNNDGDTTVTTLGDTTFDTRGDVSIEALGQATLHGNGVLVHANEVLELKAKVITSTILPP